MAKVTIKECIKRVLSDAGAPMSSGDIYEKIREQSLYEFNTANPSNVVRSQLRRHCRNLQRKDSADGIFEMTADGLFRLAD